MGNKNSFTQVTEIDLNEDLKIGLKKLTFRYVLKHQEEINKIPELLKDAKNLSKNIDKIFETVETFLTYAMVDPKNPLKKILSKDPKEGQCLFEDFNPDVNWELLEAQGIKNVLNGDINFALFAYLMEQINALNFGGAKQVENFPEERTGDENINNGKKLSDKAE